MRSNLYDQISAFYDQPSVVINSSFANLSSANFDLGYRSLIKNGQEKHLITRNISLRVQHIKDAKMQNLLFSNSAQSGKTERLFRFIGAPFRFSGTLVKETGSAYSCH